MAYHHLENISAWLALSFSQITGFLASTPFSSLGIFQCLMTNHKAQCRLGSAIAMCGRVQVVFLGNAVLFTTFVLVHMPTEIVICCYLAEKILVARSKLLHSPGMTTLEACKRTWTPCLVCRCPVCTRHVSVRLSRDSLQVVH